MGSATLRIDTLDARRDRVAGAIWRASARTGVDFTYLMNQARVESSFDPAARARTSSATGLFQFIEQSWLAMIDQHGARHGLGWAADAITRGRDGRYRVADPESRRAILALRGNAEVASQMAGEFARVNADHLTRKLGRAPNATDLYFAHFLGAAGASRFLAARDAAPGASAAALFPRQAAANRSIFYTRAGQARSLDQIYQLMARKLGGSAGAGPLPRVEMVRSPDDPALSPLPPATGTAQALADRGDAAVAANPLRPRPADARLAYLMVVSALDS